MDVVGILKRPDYSMPLMLLMLEDNIFCIFDELTGCWVLKLAVLTFSLSIRGGNSDKLGFEFFDLFNKFLF